MEILSLQYFYGRETSIKKLKVSKTVSSVIVSSTQQTRVFQDSPVRIAKTNSTFAAFRNGSKLATNPIAHCVKHISSEIKYLKLIY
mgnify:CR=1 FL=1